MGNPRKYAPDLKFCTFLARYIDDSAESRGVNYIDGDARGVSLNMFYSHRSEMYLPREQISPDQNITPFPLLVSFPLTAVLIDVAPISKSEKLVIEECEKASVMTTDWR